MRSAKGALAKLTDRTAYKTGWPHLPSHDHLGSRGVIKGAGNVEDFMKDFCSLGIRELPEAQSAFACTCLATALAALALGGKLIHEC
jgi:hypothetical protein